jgi:peptidoglycan/LPS O-acetylase OafA/YrhL
LGHFWTLSAEEQFYVLWPITLLFFLRATRLRSLQYISFGVCLTLVLLGQFIVISDPKVNFAFQHVLVRPSILLAGCAIAIFETRNRISSKIKFSNFSLILGLILCVWGAFSSGDIWVFGILLIGASQLIDRGNSRNLLAKALNIWPLPQLGLLSYSIYIWHFESIRIAHQLSPDSQIIHGIVSMALLLMFSIVSFNFIEKPAQRFIVAKFAPMISKSKKE